MRMLKAFPFLLLMLTFTAFSALAQTTIISPTSNEQVTSPFILHMTASTCSSLAVSTVGYSLDNSTSTATFNTQSMDGPVSAPSGPHTIHIKVWNYEGGVCVTDVAITVVAAASGALAVVPSDAAEVSSIQTLSNWTAIHDGGTPGESYGSTSITSSPSLTGAARLFANQFNYFGGERYSASFSDDVNASNFLYDTWVYIETNADGFSNLEFDLEQTMANGETVVIGFQCDGWTGTWDYAVNSGSPTAYNDTWLHSSAPCNVHSWGANQWHHVQIYSSRNTSGWVTYQAVWVDGVQQNINATVFSGYALGWAPTILTNFQIDGDSSGTTWGNVYLDALTVYRW